MNLLKTFLRLMFVRNKINYLLVILSIAAAYAAISIIMVYIDNVLYLSSDFMHPRIHYLYITIRTIIVIGGIFFVISQYYNIMRSGMRDYCILKTLGATKHNIRILIIFHELFLIFVTLPIGLYLGLELSTLIIHSLGDPTVNDSVINMLHSVIAFTAFAFISCCFIVCIGIYLEQCVRKTTVSTLLTENSPFSKEVGII